MFGGGKGGEEECIFADRINQLVIRTKNQKRGCDNPVYHPWT